MCIFIHTKTPKNYPRQSSGSPVIDTPWDAGMKCLDHHERTQVHSLKQTAKALKNGCLEDYIPFGGRVKGLFSGANLLLVSRRAVEVFMILLISFFA